MSLSTTIMAAVHTIQTWGLWLGAQMQVLLIASPVIFWSGISLIALGTLYGVYNFIMGGKKPKKSTKEVGVGTDGDFTYYEEMEDDESLNKQVDPTEKKEEELDAGATKENAHASFGNASNPEAANAEDAESASNISSDFSADSDNQQELQPSQPRTSHDVEMRQEPRAEAGYNNGANNEEYIDIQVEGLPMQENNIPGNNDNQVQEAVTTIASYITLEAILAESNRNTLSAFNQRASSSAQNSRHEQEYTAENSGKDRRDYRSSSVVNYDAAQGTGVPQARDWQMSTNFDWINQTPWSQTSNRLDSKPVPMRAFELASNASCLRVEPVSNSSQLWGGNPVVTKPVAMPTIGDIQVGTPSLAPNSGPSLNQVGMFGTGMGYMQRAAVPAALSLSMFVAIPWMVFKTLFSMRARAGY